MDRAVLSVPTASVLFVIDFGDARLGTAELAALVPAVGALTPATDDAERIDRIRILEQLRSAVAAAQLAETAWFVASQRQAQKAAGVPAERVGRGITHQVALARRISPYQANRFVQAATILTTELPHTMRELATGRTSEWRATIVARETAWLAREHRATVDRALAPRLEHLGDRGVEAEAKKLAYRLDPHGFVQRLKQAENDRRVTLRPAPDTMARLSALLPVAQGVAAFAALGRDADTLIGQGDARARGQLMADLLVERLTGQSKACDVPVEIGLVMTERALLHGDGEPAILDGYGPVPAPTARDLIAGLADEVPVWLRQLYTHPTTGHLVAMGSKRRFFGGALRRFVTYRDQYCRTPWCGAPIRHVDHAQPAQHGGPTSSGNAQGLCQACNHAKQAPGWDARTIPTRGRHLIEITTPTGHRYRSRAPDPPGGPGSPLEHRFRRTLEQAIDTVWAA